MDDVRLDFDREAIEAIADKASERNTGARGLRAMCGRDNDGLCSIFRPMKQLNAVLSMLIRCWRVRL